MHLVRMCAQFSVFWQCGQGPASVSSRLALTSSVGYFSLNNLYATVSLYSGLSGVNLLNFLYFSTAFFRRSY